MKQQLQQLIAEALNQLVQQNIIEAFDKDSIHIEWPRDQRYGDYASNIALILSKQTGIQPSALAEKIIEYMKPSVDIDNISIAGPGFINFKMSDTAYFEVIRSVFSNKHHYGRSQLGKNCKVHLEYISANPTGPLHVGHGRSAAYGSSLANLLEASGYTVHREYYVNDAGRQMDILAVSVWLRYLEYSHEEIKFPSKGYQGEYIKDIAEKIYQQHQNKFKCATHQVFDDLPLEDTDDVDPEQHIDTLIDKAKDLLGDENFEIIKSISINEILNDIHNDLAEFGVHYQHWYSEKKLFENSAVKHAIQKLRDLNLVYEREGALWFNSSKFGDEKDRVLIRSNRQMTYFAADIAYHIDKFERGYNLAIDVFGADHHSYMVRMQSAMKAIGFEKTHKLIIQLVQFATLYRGKERVSMSTRGGSFVTLRQLREEVGNDAARFFYIMRKAEQHLAFDLELAKSQSSDNPVYYIQYAHARICSVFKQLQEKGLKWDEQSGLKALKHLHLDHEKELMVQIARYPEMIEAATLAYEPHQLAHYLRELANSFHVYYNAHQFIVEEKEMRNARLCLIVAVRQVLLNGLTILGICAPEQM